MSQSSPEVKARYRAKHADRLRIEDRERARLRRAADPQYFRDVVSRYSARNPDVVRARTQAWREKNKPHLADYSKTKRLSDIAKHQLYSVRGRAMDRGLEYDLTPEWFRALYEKGSALSGIPFVSGLPRGRCFYTASVDRIDPTKGYVQSNCRLILMQENMFKGAMNDEQMLEIARAMIAKADA